MNEWISVKDRLPNDGQDVIGFEDYTTIGKKHRGAECFHYRAEFGFVNRPTDEDGYGLITHWMPLPAAPKEPL